MSKKALSEQLVVSQKYLKNNDVVCILLFSYYPSLIFKSQTTPPSLATPNPQAYSVWNPSSHLKLQEAQPS